MRWYDLRTGYTCNQHCRFCDQGDRRDTHGDAATEAVLSMIRGAGVSESGPGRAPGARPGGDRGLWLAGGEVTLRRDLPTLVRAAREAGFQRVGLQSNGRVLAAAGAAASLRAAGLTDVALAVHAPTAAVHDWLTELPGSFAAASTAARRVREAGLGLVVHTVMSRSLVPGLDTMAAWVLRVGAGAHRWYHPTARGRPPDPTGRWPEAPRLGLLELPLQAALRTERAARVEAEVVGLPLCVLGGERASAADRPDLPGVTRLFPPGWEEAPGERRFGPGCEGCALRPGCVGLDAGYAARWGFDELRPERQGPPASGRARPDGRPPTPDEHPPGPDPRAPGPDRRAPVPDARRAESEGRRPEPEGPAVIEVDPGRSRRSLRQALVAAAAPGRALRFAGADPWAHEALPALLRDAGLLGYGEVTVDAGPTPARRAATTEE